MQKYKVLVGIVVYNEEGKIEIVLKRLEKIVDTKGYKIVFVNDHSNDNSLSLIQSFAKKYPQVLIINNTQNSGVGKSIRKVITYGRKHKFDICVIMAGNGKDNPSEIDKLLSPIHKNDIDYVQGSRFLNGGSFNNLPLPRKFMIKGFTFIVKIFTGYYGTDASNGFRAYKLAIFDDKRINLEQSWLNRYELETYLHYKVTTLGYKITEVPVSKNYLPSVRNYSKIKPFIDWWKMIRPLFLLKIRLKN